MSIRSFFTFWCFMEVSCIRPSQNAGRAISLENAAPLIGCILRKLAHTRSNKLRMHPLCSHFQRSNGECPAYLKMVECTNVTLKLRISVRMECQICACHPYSGKTVRMQSRN